jgi:hypothetical protein
MKMNSILLRIAIIVFAVGFTAFTFNFWGDFSRAMDNYLTMTTKEDAPAKPSGVVTMSIIQPKSGCANDKKQPCPKP